MVMLMLGQEEVKGGHDGGQYPHTSKEILQLDYSPRANVQLLLDRPLQIRDKLYKTLLLARTCRCRRRAS